MSNECIVCEPTYNHGGYADICEHHQEELAAKNNLKMAWQKAEGVKPTVAPLSEGEQQAIRKANAKLNRELSRFWEPYDRFGKPLRKNLPPTLAEFRNRSRRRG